MVESDKKSAPASILKQPNPAAGKRQRAPMIKQTVSKHNSICFLLRKPSLCFNMSKNNIELLVFLPSRARVWAHSVWSVSMMGVKFRIRELLKLRDKEIFFLWRLHIQLILVEQASLQAHPQILSYRR